MEKIYKAGSDISINIVLDNGENMHVNFTPLSQDGSLYRTDKEEVQRGLERHYQFGRLFTLAETLSDEVSVQDDGEQTADAAASKTKAGPTRVEVSDWDSAKDWLAEHTNVSRSQLRSQKSIIEAAAANGYEFVIED